MTIFVYPFCLQFSDTILTSAHSVVLLDVEIINQVWWTDSVLLKYYALFRIKNYSSSLSDCSNLVMNGLCCPIVVFLYLIYQIPVYLQTKLRKETNRTRVGPYVHHSDTYQYYIFFCISQYEYITKYTITSRKKKMNQFINQSVLSIICFTM